MHASINIEAETKLTVGESIFSKKAQNYTIEDAIKGIGREVATNSFFYKKSAYENHPIFCQIAPCDDYVIPIVCAESGLIHYMPNIMSAHRIEANNSLSASWKLNPEQKKAYNAKYEKLLDELDKYTCGRYHNLIEEERTRLWFKYFIKTRDKDILKEKRYRQYFLKLPIKRRIKIIMSIYFPNTLKNIREIKRTYKINHNKRKNDGK